MHSFHAAIVAVIGVFAGPIAAEVAVDQVENSAVMQDALRKIEDAFDEAHEILDDATGGR